MNINEQVWFIKQLFIMAIIPPILIGIFTGNWDQFTIPLGIVIIVCGICWIFREKR
jgi:hypothetical protein